MCHAHNGGAGSFYAEIKILPERNMVLAYMANAAEPSEAIAQDVLAAVYQHFAGAEVSAETPSCKSIGLGGDFDVVNGTAGLWNGKTISLHAFRVKLDG